MQKRFIAVLFLLTSLILILNCLPVHGEAEIYDTVVRLHVLANSDSEEDQALKLKVRDALLEISDGILTDCKSQEEAASAIEKSKDLLTQAANEVIRSAGFDYPVNIELGYENYPERTYENCCFPSGEYLSLRVLIGHAEGQNWWCVLFPPLCLSAASADQSKDPEDAFISVGLNKEQYGIITETGKTKYKIRFKILEAVENWWR